MSESDSNKVHNHASDAETILDNLNIGVFGFNADGDILYLNKTFQNQIKFDDREQARNTTINLLSGNFDEPVLQKIASYIPDIVRKKLQSSREIYANNKYYLFETIVNGEFGKNLFTGKLTDITENKLTQKKLQERQRELTSLMDNLPGMAFRCKYDEYWTMIFMSQACRDLTGYSTQDILWNKRLSYQDLILPKDREWVKNVVDKAVSRNDKYQVEYRIITKEGKIKWMYEQAKAHVNPEDEIDFIEGIILDISSRKYAEKVRSAVGLIAEMSMKEIDFDNEKYFRNVQELVNGFMNAEYFSVIYYDVHSDQLKSLYSSDKIMMHDLNEVKEPRKTLSYKVIKEDNPLLLNSDEVREMEGKGNIKIYGKESEQWLGIPMSLNNGNKGAVVVQNYDAEINFTQEDLKSLELIVHQISLAINRKDAVDALTKREKYYRNLYMNLPVSYQTLDSHGKVVIVNERWLELLQYPRDQVLGKSFGDFWAENQSLSFKDFWEKLLDVGYIDRQLIKIQKKDGEVRDVIVTGHKETDQLGVFVRAHFVFADVTMVIQAEKAMRRAKEKAEENDKLKSAFLANMSHEIRSPMNAILGFSDLLKTPNLEPARKEKYIKLIHERSDDLMRIIDDIIDISKLEAGSLKLHYEQVDMQEFIDNLEMSCHQEQKRLKKEHIDVAVENKTEFTDLNWFIDHVRLRQILINFMNNALKFTSEGSVKLVISREHENILFSVHDTGIGIPKDKQEFIFEHFRQVDLEYKTAKAGTGLGLSISKSLANQMNGKIFVNSEPGEGSIFTLVLPFQNVENKSTDNQENLTTKTQNQEKNISASKLVYVYDLNEDNIDVIQNVLKAFNHVKFILRSIGENNFEDKSNDITKDSAQPDLILFSYYADKKQQIDLIRHIQNTYPETPIVALLNNVKKTEKDQLMSAGIHDYIAMPVNEGLMKAVLMKNLG